MKAIKKPRAKNAPGGRINNKIPSASTNLNPNNERLPKISLNDPSINKAMENPRPIPNPSSMDETTACFEANASARPRTIQFTTINGIKRPSCSCRSGRYPAITKSTTVTKDAIITIKAGILTLSGIKFLTREITTLDMSKTNVVAKPIPRPLMAVDVTPRVGHIPSSWTKTAFSLKNPLVKFCKLLMLTSLHIHIESQLCGLSKCTGCDRCPGKCIYISAIFFYFHVKCRWIFT